MKRILSVLLTLTILVIPAVGLAQQQHQSGHAKPYAGFETRPIKSLSDGDIEELARGAVDGGWRYLPSSMACPARLTFWS